VIDFKPSQVSLCVPPLVATMGKGEIEAAASLLVRACHVLGDKWQAVTGKQVADVLRADRAAAREPFTSLIRNPFFRPDIHAAIAAGFIEGDPASEVKLTEKGLEALRRWVMPAGVDAAKGGA